MNILDRLRSRVRPRPTCEDVNHFLAEYLDDALDPETRAKYEVHLRNCPNCATYLDQYQATITVVRDLDASPPPPELAERTLAFLRAHLGQGDAEDEL